MQPAPVGSTGSSCRIELPLALAIFESRSPNDNPLALLPAYDFLPTTSDSRDLLPAEEFCGQPAVNEHETNGHETNSYHDNNAELAFQGSGTS